jgi:uncharacterized membrane protein YjjP (DUF1212 family)
MRRGPGSGKGFGMINKKQKSVLILALFAGELMLRSGAEIYRVEDTITRICRACGIHYVECFATTTGIFLSLDGGREDDNMHTFIKRIQRINIDLGKISLINKFSRAFTATDLSIEEGFAQLREISRIKPYSLPMNLLGALFIGASLCLCFGGLASDAIVSAVITMIVYLLSIWVGKLQLSPFIGVFVSCAACALLSVISIELGLLFTLSPAIIASITMFLPGVAITNAARDLLSGDMLAGVSRFAEALINAVAIAGGVSAVLKPWSLARGGFPSDEVIRYPLLLFFLLAFLTTLGFCIQFHVPQRQMLPASVIGACGFCLYEFSLLDLGQSPVAASFLASGLVAVMAEFASRAGRDATTLFIIPGIIPLVPGTGMYTAMSYVMQDDFANAASTGASTFFMAGSIAIAIVIVASLCRIIMAFTGKIADSVRQRRAKAGGGQETEGSDGDAGGADISDSGDGHGPDGDRD